MDTLECIKTRRSIRSYTDQIIDSGLIDKLIDSAIWAPSGKNGQPWKFCIITDKDKINIISDLSIYGKWMRTAPCFIVVLLDKNKSYDYLKDAQSCGAAIQNILLTAHSLGLGTCWIGEILKMGEKIKNILDIHNDQVELMAAITIGYPQGSSINADRKDFLTFIV